MKINPFHTFRNAGPRSHLGAAVLAAGAGLWYFARRRNRA
jgi:hypothetical protein